MEPGNKINGVEDHWDPAVFKAFMKDLKNDFGQDNLGISTFARLDVQPHCKAIMQLAPPYVCFAPQIYWNFRDPMDHTRKTVASWAQAGITTPLIATVQSYWDRTSANDPETPPQADVEAKVKDFVAKFTDADCANFIGLNWYHGGKAPASREGGMSNDMITNITAGRFDRKPYKRP